MVWSSKGEENKKKKIMNGWLGMMRLHGCWGQNSQRAPCLQKVIAHWCTLFCMRFPPFLLPLAFCFGHNYTCPPLHPILPPSPTSTLLPPSPNCFLLEEHRRQAGGKMRREDKSNLSTSKLPYILIFIC